jgi:hypothetical protein
MRTDKRLMMVFGLIAFGYLVSKVVTPWVNNAQKKFRAAQRKRELQTWEGEGGNVVIPSLPI